MQKEKKKEKNRVNFVIELPRFTTQNIHSKRTTNREQIIIYKFTEHKENKM